MGTLAEIQADRAVDSLSDALRKFCLEGEEGLASANRGHLRFALAELSNAAELVRAAQSLQDGRHSLVDKTDLADLEYAPGGCGESLVSCEVVRGTGISASDVDPHYKPSEAPNFNQ